VIEHDQLRIDAAAHEVPVAGMPISLRRMEYALVVHLARDPHRVYTKDEPLRDGDFRAATTSIRTVDSHASRLRRKLAQAGANGWVTATWGSRLPARPAYHAAHWSGPASAWTSELGGRWHRHEGVVGVRLRDPDRRGERAGSLGGGTRIRPVAQ
jgi:hypothetical protein